MIPGPGQGHVLDRGQGPAQNPVQTHGTDHDLLLPVDDRAQLLEAEKILSIAGTIVKSIQPVKSTENAEKSRMLLEFLI